MMASRVEVEPGYDGYTLTFQFRSERPEVPLYILTSANAWAVEPMAPASEEPTRFEKTFVVPRDTQEIQYKFRYGDSDYFWDIGSPTENDNRGGMNNRFEIPSMPPPPFFDNRIELPTEASEPSSPHSFVQLDGHGDGIQTPRNPASPTFSVATTDTSGCISLSESDRWTTLSDDIETVSWA